MNLPHIVEAVGLAIGALVLLTYLLNSFVNIGADELGITERRFVGQALRAGNVFARGKEVGLNADYLNPGLHFLPWPFVNLVKRVKFTAIGSDDLCLVEARDGAPLPAGRIFAEDPAGDAHNNFQDPVAFLEHGGVRGMQLRILTTGTYKINRQMFGLTPIKKTTVPKGSIGVVIANDGAPLASLLGPTVEGHDDFQDAATFLRNGGQKGPQMGFLRPGAYNINTAMFEVRAVPATVIAEGYVGHVEARDGKPMPVGTVVAATPEGHNNYQDAHAFLAAGGFRGPQEAVLPPGTYYINPLMFEVTPVAQTIVPQGAVAVLISNVGADPSTFKDPEHEDAADQPGAQRHVVPTGYRGIQRDTLGPGRYNINPAANQVVLVPTAVRSVEWCEDDDAAEAARQQGPGPVTRGLQIAEANFAGSDQSKLLVAANAAALAKAAGAQYTAPSGQGKPPSAAVERLSNLFDPFEVISNDGFSMRVEVRCQYRILPEDAPYVVQRLGSVYELERNVLHPLIDGIFRAQVSRSPALNYQQNRVEEQEQAAEAVRAAVAPYRVQIIGLMITNIHLPKELMEATQKKNLATQQKAMYDAQQEAEVRRAELTRSKAQADAQERIVAAQAGIEVTKAEAEQAAARAEGEGRKAVIAARADAERVALAAAAAANQVRTEGQARAEVVKSIGEAEAAATEARGVAQAKAYAQQAEALTPAGLTTVEVMRLLGASKLKVVPDIMMGATGGDGAGSLLQLLLANSLRGGVSTPES